MKYIVIVPDGMFDRAVEKLGGKTPLQVAHTANMDFMAKNGFVGLVNTIREKMPLQLGCILPTQNRRIAAQPLAETRASSGSA